MAENLFQTKYRYWKRNLHSRRSLWAWNLFHNKQWYQRIKARRRDQKRSLREKEAEQGRYEFNRLKQEEPDYLNRYMGAVPGTAEWLACTEIIYGGVTTAAIEREKVRAYDLRYLDNSEIYGARGGDRMLHHGYAKHYQYHLQPYVQDRDKRFVICEFGILKGTGLAIWCDLFPNARIIGFDLDLSNIKNNMDNLIQLGAFSNNQPELFEYDQFVYSADYLREILGGDQIDICIDDGHHSDESILTTFKSVKSNLNEKFVYMIEDNSYVHRNIRSKYKGCTLYSYSELTVVTSLPS